MPESVKSRRIGGISSFVFLYLVWLDSVEDKMLWSANASAMLKAIFSPSNAIDGAVSLQDGNKGNSAWISNKNQLAWIEVTGRRVACNRGYIGFHRNACGFDFALFLS